MLNKNTKEQQTLTNGENSDKLKSLGTKKLVTTSGEIYAN